MPSHQHSGGEYPGRSTGADDGVTRTSLRATHSPLAGATACAQERRGGLQSLLDKDRASGEAEKAPVPATGTEETLQDLCAHLLGHTYQFKDGQRGELIKFTIDGVDKNTKITANGTRGEFLMELNENEVGTVRARCEKDYPNIDVTMVACSAVAPLPGRARPVGGALLEYYLRQYSWNACSGQLLLNARRVP